MESLKDMENLFSIKLDFIKVNSKPIIYKENSK